ncbi:MAG: PQQ-dependent sugar dehydrogenase, partial [Gammaproteobacteria bacterium]|nr:PQQ-dependent sugar dehydrogenase [Gammaproteobacteria bacterium]
GGNYGWPVIEGDEIADRMISPVLQSGPDVTWAPAGIAHLGGNLYFAGLRGEALYQLPLDNTITESLRAHFFSEYGRLRDVRVGPDGFIYVTTSNQDGRGQPQAGDDKILRVNPAALLR